MPEMTGGQALMKSLFLEGVRVIFGLPGVQLYHAMDALYHEPGIRFITTRHEQATGYMADGYSRAGGDGIGTALMVPGPGLQNASAGIGTAYAASSPIMVVCGQIERDLIGSDRGMLHEVNDQLETIKPVTKWAKRILDPAEIPEAVHEAFRNLKTGRPRPVEIEVPPETLADMADVELREPEEPRKVQADRGRVEQAAKMLTEASNPLIWVGGGVISSGATQSLAGASPARRNRDPPRRGRSPHGAAFGEHASAPSRRRCAGRARPGATESTDRASVSGAWDSFIVGFAGERGAAFQL